MEENYVNLEKDQTEAIIARLKKDNKTVFHITVFDDDDNKVSVFLKKPSRLDLRPVLALISTDEIRACEILYNLCFLEGDARVILDDDMFLQAKIMLDDLLKVKIGEIQKH